MFRRRVSQAPPTQPATIPARSGQLDNRDLEALVKDALERENWQGAQERVVVEVGTGGGRGSTVAIHRALAAGQHPFRLVGYEGDAELATEAAAYWGDTQNVQVVNEYFMHREDIDLVVKPRVAPADRDAYLPEFDAVAVAENFLETAPPGLIDLLFVDSVRYTHLAILRAALPWLRPETIVVMEDDIPEHGELAIIETELALRDISRHELDGHPWPLVEFRVAV